MFARAVFLDFDGCVSCVEGSGWRCTPFSPEAACGLSELCRLWGAGLVLTSAWRYGARLVGDDAPFPEAAARFLSANGIDAPLFPGDACAVPALWSMGEEAEDNAASMRVRHRSVAVGRAGRGDEVRLWLDTFTPWMTDNDWLLVDDESDYWPEQGARLIRCNPERGYDARTHALALKLAGVA